MKRSNLEPGCLAVIVGGVVKENYGKIVTCVRYIGKVPELVGNYTDSDIWEVNQPVRFNFGAYHNLCSGKTMQRIDDGKDDFEKETCLNIDLYEFYGMWG